jgi:hypothetical protein
LIFNFILNSGIRDHHFQNQGVDIKLIACLVNKKAWLSCLNGSKKLKIAKNSVFSGKKLGVPFMLYKKRAIARR